MGHSSEERHKLQRQIAEVEAEFDALQNHGWPLLQLVKKRAELFNRWAALRNQLEELDSPE